MKREILVKQRDITDCGAACLSSVASHYGLKFPVSRIRQFAGTDKKGTNAYGMIEAAKKLGFSAKGVKGSIDAIPGIPVPTIAHVILKEVLHHYVVIYKISKKEVIIMDPGLGTLSKYSINDFEKIWSGVLILLSPNIDFQKRDEKVSVFSRFWYLIRPHKSILTQSVIGAALYTIIGLTSAIYVQKIVDFVLPSNNLKLLNLLSFGMIFLLGIQILINSFKSVFILKTGQQIDAKLILGYYKHLLSLPQRFFDTMRTGEIISRINDAVKIRLFINETGINILINCFIIIFSFALMFTYYWKLAIMIFIIIPIFTIIYLISNHLNRKVERKVMEGSAELESHLVESLNGIKTIKSFGMKDFANLKTEMRFVNLLTTIYKSGLNDIFSSNVSLTISRLFTIILLWIGSIHVMEQKITPGELMSFYAIIGYFMGPIIGVIGANKSYQNAIIASDRLFEILDLEGLDNDGKIHIKAEDINDIVFENVRFKYGTRANVFENLNITFKKGEITVIIGESGSGKSTIGSLIKRIYPVDGGSIMIGGYNLDIIHEDSLNQLIGIVPQEVDLFSGSILENIALGEFETDNQRILKLANKIGALQFINDLPDAFNSLIDENGSNLSGGQRKRLAILRALYPDPEIIVFDEATASLDHKSERFIINTMMDLKKQGKTVIAITHNINTAQISDKIILLDHGSVISQGCHTDLINHSIEYKSFMNKVHQSI